jgi:protein-export membrane protein SecD/preprotein translocase SecF subunit
MSRRLRWRLLIAVSLTLGFSLFVWYPPLATRCGLPLPDLLRSRTLKLGLDLAGGVQMQLRVNTVDAIAVRARAAIEQIREGLAGEGAKVPQQLEYSAPDGIVISGVDVADDGAVRRIVNDVAEDFEIKSSANGRYVLGLKPAARAALHRDVVEQARETVGRRVDELGVAEPMIAVQGAAGDELLVQLPGVTDVERAKSILGTTAKLEWKMVEAGPLTIPPGEPPSGTEVVADSAGSDRAYYLVRSTPDITGNDLRTARSATDEYGRPAVAFSLTPDAGRRFATLTANNVGRAFAILLDGRVQSAPVIEGRIPNGEGRIAGRFSAAEAADLALVLRSGALPASLTYMGGNFVGPSLGNASIESGILASLTGLALVASFMLLYYHRSGLNALLSIGANLLLMLGLMAVSGGVLTLPGIAGLILTIGMGVDSNVLVFERIKEELAAGRSVRQAVAAGFDRVLLTILDTHVASLIAAAFLFQFGTGPIRGFATTLTFGLLTNVFTAVFVSRTLFELVLARGGRLRFTAFIPTIATPKLDVYRWRWPAFALSALVIAIGGWMSITRGGLPLGLEFSGGSSVLVKFEQPVSEQAIRDAIPGDEVVQWYGRPADNALLVRRPLAGTRDDGSLANAVAEVESALSDGGFPAFSVGGSETVGPSAGAELRRRASWATAASLAGIAGYIAVRFRPGFAAGAMAATVHDLLVTAAMLRITGYELSLNVVAAILTITGYSVNDTIVTFDRAREQWRARPGAPLKDVVNAAVNQTFGRTVITGGTTLLAVLALYLFGGEALEGFAFSMLVGIISGTYSTVFIATAVLLMVSRKARARTKRA